jgi:hypothetical protein
MAVHNSQVGRIDLQEEGNGAFISETVFKASLYLLPFTQIHPIVKSSTDENQSSYTDHIVAGQINVCFIIIDADFL